MVEACSRFKQGHLVTRPPFFYGATAGYGIWDLTRDAGDAAQDHEVLQLDDDLAPNYGLITTQTCDIYEERKPRKPWVQVAPVYDGQELIPASSIGNLQKDAIGHLMLLDSLAIGEGLWVVDFRIEFPLEKSWLVGKEPIEAFATAERYLRLADRLAGRVGRPALSEGLVQVYRAISAWWEEESEADQDAKAPVADVRLAIVGGDRLAPTDAYLLIVTDDVPMSEAGKSAWQDCWTRVSDLATGHGINFTANAHETLDSLTARGLRNTAPLWPF
jgi:hypothetical protein